MILPKKDNASLSALQSGQGRMKELYDLIKEAVKEKASDIHLRAGSIARIRIDGELYDVEGLTPDEAELERFIFDMLTPEQIEQFRKTHDLDFSYTFENVARMRVCLFHERGKFCVAFRLIPAKIPTMEEIYLPKVCYKFVNMTKGLVLVTGPTGSGKSTTLAAMIDYINKNRRCHIVTIEDPIEYVHEDQLATISQREVLTDTMSFHSALRHAFRQDPDVILLGEMRDQETMQTAITLAETGHLTFSTLHTGEAPQTITRIIDSFSPHQQQQIRIQLSLSLAGIISQQLLPLKSGRGRVACREVLVCNQAIENLIRENKIPQIKSAIQTGLEDGMITMNTSLGELLEQGMISYDTANAYSWDKKSFEEKYAHAQRKA